MTDDGTRIEIGGDHWRWHVDQLAGIVRDYGHDGADLLFRIRRAAFVGDGPWRGTAETWQTIEAEARRRMGR